MSQRIKRVLQDQRLELEEKFKRTKVIEREVLSKLKEVMGSNLVKVTTGIRRSGKSFPTMV